MLLIEQVGMGGGGGGDRPMWNVRLDPEGLVGHIMSLAVGIRFSRICRWIYVFRSQRERYIGVPVYA